MKPSRIRFQTGLFLALFFCALVAGLWHWKGEPDRAADALPASSQPAAGGIGAASTAGHDSASPGIDAATAGSSAKVEITVRARALAVANRLAAHPAGLAEIDAFNAWTARYLAASDEERKAIVDQGISLATARRSALAKLIPSDPRRAVENAVPPVVRQELPAAVVARLEERVNERAFFGVLGVAPTAENAGTPAYRREVRTDDGGYYRAFVYGNRGSQPTTAGASIVGIAVDDLLAVDERPLRIVASGEIPNHPNNLTRRRTVIPLDEQGFTQGRELRESPAPPRSVVETCPVSGKSTAAPKAEDGAPAAVTAEQVVVEAGGQFHYLCSGGHILGFEEDLIAREGANGGPIKPTSPPAATQSTGYKSHLLMRIAFPEALRGSVTEAEGHTLGKNVQDWFVDTSYGAMSFLTTVSPLLVLPRTEAWYKDQDTGSAFEVLTDARAAAKLAGFDPANFDFDTVIYTGTPGGFGGQAYVGGKGCWLKSGTGTGVACHEYGHNFGLWHSNFWSTTNGSTIGGGTHQEYGDNFDTMGSASAGDYQFNAYQKNLLNWIPTAGVQDVPASGTYRIYQMDQPRQDPHLRYAMKIRKDADRDYWVDLRQRFASNAWVQGGVFLHWSPWVNSGSGTHLLDATPGSIDAKTDAPLVIGRTFSDPESGVHITPIAKNATSPTSVDVVVNLGTFAGNQAPVASLAADATSVATGVAVNFTATATDPDGDALSYAWDFGDKSFSTANSPAVSKSWAAAGEYRVRCTVSDMKGKTASSSVIITVGSPTTFRVAGTITAGGLPLHGVRVHNSLTGTSYREAYTDSDGTYTLVGLAAGTYTVGTQLYGHTLTPTGSASVTVGPNASGVDFSATDLAQVSIAVQDADCAEGANTGMFRISRTGSTAAALTVNCYYPSGSATKPTDYTLTPDILYVTPYYTLTIPAGQAFLDVLVTAVDDAATESFETATLELVPSTNYVLGNAAATITIADSDTANPLVRMKVTDRDADESGDAGQFTIERLGSTTNSLGVIVALSGTATNGTDYATLPTTITIPAGASTVPVNVTPQQDSTVEPMETVTLTISTNAAYTRAASSADYSGTVNLHDDDAPTITIVATDSAAAEAGSDPGVFTVTRTGDTSQALTVNYGLTGSSLHGTDYLALPGVLTIPAGSASATVVITPIDDTIGEPAQTAVLQIRSGTTYVVGAANSATVTITDNGDVPYAAINVTSAQATESGTTGTFRITTTGTGTGNITVRYAVSGTATNGTDYSLLSGTVLMVKNGTSNITITPLQDTEIEGYETITLSLLPDPAYSLTLDSSATLNLQDDELPQVNVSGTDDSFSETNGSLAKFFISRTGATTNPLTVNYTLGGTATPGVDYTAPTGSVTIAAAATGAYVDVSMLADSLAEGTETINLNVAADPTYALGIGSTTRYINDAQSASVPTQVGFSASSSSSAESAGTVNIPVTLNAAAASDVTVEYYINGGTALGAGIDYGLAAGVITFAPGEVAKTVPVTIVNDTLAENNETVIVSLRNSNNARLGTISHTITITDNDGGADTTPPSVTVTPSGSSTNNSPITFTLTFSESVSGLTAAGITVTNGTKGTLAGSGTTYTIPVTPTAQGAVTCQVNAGAAQDGAGNPNTVSNTASVTYDTVVPTVAVTPSGTTTGASPITFTLTFSEPVSLTASGITVTNGTKGQLSGGGAAPTTIYTIPVTPTAQGAVTCQVNAGAAFDTAGNGNTASNIASVIYDTGAPTVTVTPSGTSTGTSPITFTLTFSESVTGLTAAGITVTNGTKGALGGSGTTYTIPVTPSAQGAVTCQVNAGAAVDAASNGNTVSNTASVTYDSVAPTVTVTPSGTFTGTSPITFTLTFSESVTGLTAAEITVTNGTKGSLSGSGTTYTIPVTPSAQGTVTCQVIAGAAIDAASNGNSVSNTASVTYDSVAPTVAVTPSGTFTGTSPITFTLTFSESVTGLTAAEITVTNGTKGSLSGSGTTYTIPVTPSAQGAVTCQVIAGAAIDAASNGNSVSNTASVTYDSVAPTVTVTPSGTFTGTSPITFTLTFSEPVTGLTAAEITVANGTKGALSGSGTTYTIPITPSAQGTVTCQVIAGAAVDAASNGNTVSNTASVTYDSQPPTVSISAPSTSTTTFGPVTYTVTYTDANFNASTLAAGDITLNKTGTANGTVSVTGTGTTRTVTISGTSGDGTLGISIAAGTATDLAGNSAAAAGPSATFTVSKADQTITFGPLAAQTYGNAPFTLSATASSGLPVSYTSSNPAVATVSGNTVTIVGAGSTTITASQAGSANYNAAPSVPQTQTVNQASQTITFAALPDKAVGDAPFTLGAAASSGLPVSYTSSNTAVATVSGNTVTIVAAGTTTITASQAGNTNYAAAADVAQPLTVNPTLPPPWVQSDIGAPGTAGTGSYSGGVYTVAGAGTISGKADKFHFVYQTLSADGEIVVRIPSFQNTGNSARVGVMIRDTLATGSRFSYVGVNGTGTFRWVRRTSTGGNTSGTNSSSGTAPNVWVRLTRVGSTITAYRSTNGTTWTTIGSASITMATNCYIGIAVASGTTALNTSTFDNVTVTP